MRKVPAPFLKIILLLVALLLSGALSSRVFADSGLLTIPSTTSPAPTAKIRVGNGTTTTTQLVPIESRASGLGIDPRTITPGGNWRTDPYDPRNDYVYVPYAFDFIGPRLPDKLIHISLKEQKLQYYLDGQEVGSFLVSTGVPGRDTPPGQYVVHVKYPLVDYNGVDYSFKNTKWNLLFRYGPHHGNYYIHGAYWHHNFGHVMSHGCVNVSYKDMESFYSWADVGTRVVIE